MKAAARLFVLVLACGIGTPAWSIPTDTYVGTSPGTHRAYAISGNLGNVFIYGYLGARANSEYTMRHVLPDPVAVDGEPTTVVRDAPQGYAEYWQFGGGARLSRIDEGDYDDQYTIGAFNRQNAYTPVIPVLPQDAVVGSVLSASGIVVRTYNSVVLPQTLQFESSSRVIAFEMVQLDGLSRQAFRVETAIHHWGQLFNTPNVDYTVTITNLFVDGIGLIPVRTVLGSPGSPANTIVSYASVTLASFTTDPVAFAPRTGIPPGVAIDFAGRSPFPTGVAAEVSVSNGQFAGQEHPPASFSILQGIYVVRTRAPTSANATNCGSLVVGQSAASNFCVTSWDAGGQPQSGVVAFSEWADLAGGGWADYFLTSSFSARRGILLFNGVWNDKVYNMTFNDPAGGWVSFLIAMPDNDWPRRGRFDGLTRDHTSVSMAARGCNQSISDVVIHDIQYDASRNITSFAADVEQHCELQAQALFISLRYNSRVPFNAFASPKLSSPYLLRSDFDADFRSDVLWRNASTGENYLYPMNGTQILAGEGYLRTVADLNWKIAGIGDFDGDGKADILWRNTSTGQNYIYLMSGTAILAEGYLRTVADQSWQVAGIGDFDGDGKDDILWRNSVTGENYLYPMDGLSVKPTEGYLRNVADTSWQIVGVGDFDGDGKADILWRNSVSGQNYLYPMDGRSIKPSEGYLRTVADLAWQVKGVGDFDGDGKADVVWRNSASGENYLYPMDGTTIKPTEGYLRTVADLAWQIAAVGDYDGDGRSDLLWRNSSTGQNYLYPMDGTTIKPSEGFLRTVPVGNWTVVAK